ncbi:MAG: hypothetical protein RL095_2527 [Verrucomicrobiota bacterium]
MKFSFFHCLLTILGISIFSIPTALWVYGHCENLPLALTSSLWGFIPGTVFDRFLDDKIRKPELIRGRPFKYEMPEK